MEKKCDCECHARVLVPCVFCAARHNDPPRPAVLVPLDEVHDDKTEPVVWPPLDDEGFPF
jgi:hypothetical protein